MRCGQNVARRAFKTCALAAIHHVINTREIQFYEPIELPRQIATIGRRSHTIANCTDPFTAPRAWQKRAQKVCADFAKNVTATHDERSSPCLLSPPLTLKLRT